ncbi:MAG: hypothetical protein GX682_03440 [Clostridiaceae bacterium]|nr:hypothetical protein [Clostridiaceae bacterium]
MENLVYRLVFLFFTIYVLINSISYGIYEIKNEKNKFGGSMIIAFTIFSIILGNVMIWQK